MGYVIKKCIWAILVIWDASLFATEVRHILYMLWGRSLRIQIGTALGASIELLAAQFQVGMYRIVILPDTGYPADLNKTG